ncbi:hypothetical protein L204_102748 [Cryptococcus depauperatus]|nr:hypothetical protein L204_00502 [Cryptococcus depauperatus CBS 7855]
MKFSLTLIVLLASVSATPLRLLSVAEHDDVSAADQEVELSGFDAGKNTASMVIDKHTSGTINKPCLGASGRGPLGALMSRLGFGTSLGLHHSHVHSHVQPDDYSYPRGSFMEHIRHHFSTPFIQGGVSVASMGSDEQEEDFSYKTPEIKWFRPTVMSMWETEGNKFWRVAKPSEKLPELSMVALRKGEHHQHHHHHHSFALRLEEALDNLGTYESFALAVILGLGLGALINIIVVIFILALRFFRLSAYSKHEFKKDRCIRRTERKAIRRARKEERKAKKAGVGKFQLDQEGVCDCKEDFSTEEPLPLYENNPVVLFATSTETV